MSKEKVKLTIEFDNQEAAEHFGEWLNGQGEQDYWNWMEYREEEEKGNITVIDFDYHYPQDEQYPKNDARRYVDSKFLGDMTIRTICGRLDDE